MPVDRPAHPALASRGSKPPSAPDAQSAEAQSVTEQERLRELARRVEAGEYRISSVALAERVIERMSRR